MRDDTDKPRQQTERKRALFIVDDVVSSRELLGPAKNVLIAHDAGIYTLRITRQGKLILTK